MPEFEALTLTTLIPDTSYSRPYFSTPNLVTLKSSALEVMTDLRYVAAETVGADNCLENATQKMIVRGVRSLLVVDAADNVIGVITARDLISERAFEVSAARQLEFGELKVSEVMTPGQNIEVMQLADVLHARVGDIVQTLKHSGRHHALAVETEPLGERNVIRGVFSASQIARQLGIALRSDDLRQTFAAIDRVMSQAPRPAIAAHAD